MKYIALFGVEDGEKRYYAISASNKIKFMASFFRDAFDDDVEIRLSSDKKYERQV